MGGKAKVGKARHQLLQQQQQQQQREHLAKRGGGDTLNPNAALGRKFLKAWVSRAVPPFPLESSRRGGVGFPGIDLGL